MAVNLDYKPPAQGRRPFRPAKYYPGTAYGQFLKISVNTDPFRARQPGPGIGNFGSPTGDVLEALKEASMRVGQRVRVRAQENLEDRLVPARRPAAKVNKERRRGVRAALDDQKMVYLQPRGKGVGVGDVRMFEKYDAAYVTVVERGGGFVGRLYGQLLAADGGLTTSPTTAKSVQKREAAYKDQIRGLTAQREAIRAEGSAALKRLQDVSAGRSKGDPRSAKRAVDNIRDRYNAADGRIRQAQKDFKAETQNIRAGTTRTGRPTKPKVYRDNITALAVGFRGMPKGTPGGYWWTIKKRRKAKNFMGDAADEVWSEYALGAYRRAFKKFGLTGFTKKSLGGISIQGNLPPG
jgi:hypothetical protein